MKAGDDQQANQSRTYGLAPHRLTAFRTAEKDPAPRKKYPNFRTECTPPYSLFHNRDVSEDLFYAAEPG